MDTFTTREAVRLLGVSRRTFNRWIEAHTVERETSYGPSGVEYRYTRAALEHLLRQVRGEGAASQLDERAPEGRASELAQGRQDGRSGGGQDETSERVLALPPSGQVGAFLDLLADLRDQLAQANAREERAVEEAQQLREVLAAVASRLPGPESVPEVQPLDPEPVAPTPRSRGRVAFEVAAGLLLGVGLAASVLLFAGAW